MYANEKKRITKFVRVEVECLEKIRGAAKIADITMSKMIGRICKWYFDEKWAQEKPIFEAKAANRKRLEELKALESKSSTN